MRTRIGVALTTLAILTLGAVPGTSHAAAKVGAGPSFTCTTVAYKSKGMLQMRVIPKGVPTNPHNVHSFHVKYVKWGITRWVKYDGVPFGYGFNDPAPGRSVTVYGWMAGTSCGIDWA